MIRILTIGIIVLGFLLSQNLSNQKELDSMSTNDKLMLYSIEKKSPLVAVLYSSFIPVSGHMYAGQWKRGAIISGAFAGTLIYAIHNSIQTDHYSGIDDEYDWENDNLGFDNFEEYEEYVGDMETKHSTTAIISYVAAGVLRIFEIIDASIQTEKYNKSLYNKIFNKEQNFSTQIVPIHNGANLTFTYRF